MKIQKLDTPSCMCGETPLWDDRQQILYYVDIFGKKLYSFDPASGATRSFEFPQHVGSMVLREQGGAILVLSDGLYTFDLDTGETAPLAAPEGAHPRASLNDSKVDANGRLFVGSLDPTMQESIGNFYRLDPGNKLTTIDTGFLISNGPAWSLDNKTLYFNQTFQQIIYAYDYDLATGAIANRREFANTAELGGNPDGINVDAEGLIWVAINGGGKLAAFRSDGKVERTVEVPVRLPSCMSFGGPNFDVLYVTSIDTTLAGLPAEEGAGSVYMIEGLGVKGLPAQRYRG